MDSSTTKGTRPRSIARRFGSTDRVGFIERAFAPSESFSSCRRCWRASEAGSGSGTGGGDVAGEGGALRREDRRGISDASRTGSCGPEREGGAGGDRSRGSRPGPSGFCRSEVPDRRGAGDTPGRRGPEEAGGRGESRGRLPFAAGFARSTGALRRDRDHVEG